MPMTSLILVPVLLGVGIGAPQAGDRAVENATIESDTQAPRVATVLGEEVRTEDADALQRILLTRLFDRYAERQAIAVTDGEIAAFVDDMRRGMRVRGLTAEDDLSPEEAAQVESMRRDMARAMIRQWKLNRALYRQYGGRIVFQQLGPEPLDTYRQYLEERQAAGDFEITDAQLAAQFWRYFTDDAMHSFYVPDSAAAAQAFERPPWERSTVGGESLASQPDPGLEEALRTASPDYRREIVGDTAGSEARYVYGRVDLNGDGQKEVLVLLLGSIFCGTGGCDLLLLRETADGYAPINTFVRGRLPAIASPQKTAGWHDLILRESGGGAPTSYVRYVFDGVKYVERERLPAEPIPEGESLLAGPYSYATGFPLAPRSE